MPKPGGQLLRASHSSTLVHEIFARTRTPQFQKHTRDLLVELCRIDTTPRSAPQLMQLAEERCFQVLERELRSLPFPGARVERRPINPAIQTHPSFSLLHFTKTPERPQGLSAEATYARRSNLLYFLPGTQSKKAGKSIALNAHIDVVPPYFPPRTRGETVLGRGACDDKGPVVSVIAAFKVLSEVMGRAGLAWNRNVLGMFVVEEETGGNGSLSLAIDPELKMAYESVLVCECTGLRVHPANRGAVWYRASLKPLDGVPQLELFAFINEEMETEGASIRAESRHDLFPQRPVQTCHGIIGPFGEHPSRICGAVSFTIEFDRPADRKLRLVVRDCLEAGLATYVGLYGDKTKVRDPADGRLVVRRHYDLRSKGTGFQVDVHGAAGHMGAIRERDGAITKMAHLVRSLVLSKPRLEALAGGPVRLLLAPSPAKRARQRSAASSANAEAVGESNHSELILEGGQGFVPTHTMQEIMLRLRQAAERGAEDYLRRIGRSERGYEVVRIAYEKLHNDAFDGVPNSASVRNAIAAARVCGLWKDEPILGWTVSCDARLFAAEYPGLEVLTFGPGRLAYAHSDQEQIALREIRVAAEFLSVFLLRQTGTLILGER